MKIQAGCEYLLDCKEIAGLVRLLYSQYSDAALPSYSFSRSQADLDQAGSCRTLPGRSSRLE